MRLFFGSFLGLLWVSSALGYTMSHQEYGGHGSGMIYMAHWPDGFEGGAAGVIDDGFINPGGRYGWATLLSDFGEEGAVRVQPVLRGWLDADLSLINVAGDYIVSMTFIADLEGERYYQEQTIRLNEGSHRYAFNFELPEIQWIPSEGRFIGGENYLGLISPDWARDLIAADASKRVDSLLSFRSDMRFDFVLPPEPISEPSTLMLLGAGLTGLALWQRRRRAAS